MNIDNLFSYNTKTQVGLSHSLMATTITLTFQQHRGTLSFPVGPVQSGGAIDHQTLCISRPHRLHTVYRCGCGLLLLSHMWFVCLCSTGTTVSMCKNGQSDRDASGLWCVNSRESKEPLGSNSIHIGGYVPARDRGYAYTHRPTHG